MRRWVKLFIAYFPVILLSCQVMVNLLSFTFPLAYQAAGFYLNTLFGTNLLFALFMLALTTFLRFCHISKWAALAQCLFAVYLLITKRDDVYNVLFQITVGLLALGATMVTYTRKFPACRLSHFMAFFGLIFATGGNCKEAVNRWDQRVERFKSEQLKKQFQHGRVKS